MNLNQLKEEADTALDCHQMMYVDPRDILKLFKRTEDATFSLRSISESRSVPEEAMFNKHDVGEYWRLIATARRELAKQALDRIERQ